MMRFRQQPAQSERAEHHDDDRRHRENRHHLGADDPRQQAFFQRTHVHDEHGKNDTERRPQQKADHGRGERHEAVIDEAARGIRRIAENEIHELRNDLVRRRHQRPLGIEGAVDQVR